MKRLLTAFLVSLLVSVPLVPAQLRVKGKGRIQGKHQAQPSGSTGDPFAITAGIADSTGVYVPDNYTSGFTRPNKCSSFTDSKFNTVVTRETDAWTDVPNSGLTGEYSQRPHLNITGTRLLLTDSIGGGFYVYRKSDCTLTNTPGISGADEPMWDGIDPDIIWYNTGNMIKKYNCATSTTTTVVTFNGTGGLPNFSSIEFGGGSSDVSDDNDHIGVVGDDRYGLIYKISTNEIGPVKDFGSFEAIGQFNVTADNRVMVGFNTRTAITGTVSITSGSPTVTGSGTAFTTELQQGSVMRIAGNAYNVSSVTNNTTLTLESNALTTSSGVTPTRGCCGRWVMYDKNFNYLKVVANYAQHNTYGRDPSTGGEVLLMDGAGSEVGLPSGCENSGVVRFNLADAHPQSTSTCFVGYPDFNLTGHYSWSNTRGSPWVSFSIYDGRTSSKLSGTVSITSGSPALSGSSTSFTTEIDSGNVLLIDGNFYKVSTVTNNTTATLQSNALTTGSGLRAIKTMGTAPMNSILRSDWADAGAWKKFYNELFIKNIVTGEIRRITHLRIRITGILGYWFTSRAAIAKDASFVCFSSAMGEFHDRTGTGTVSTTSGSPTVTGVGTPFVNSVASVIHGGTITINGVTKTIPSIADTTHLDADSNWGTNSGVAYTAQTPDFTNEWCVTLRAPATDFTAPTISSTNAGSITSSSATITWTTNEEATSQVEWGTTTYYGGGITAYDPTKVTSHSVNLTGLPSGTTIHYRIKTRDAAGNIKLDSDRTFVTL